jgi:hypothetical protein
MITSLSSRGILNCFATATSKPEADQNEEVPILSTTRDRASLLNINFDSSTPCCGGTVGGTIKGFGWGIEALGVTI